MRSRLKNKILVALATIATALFFIGAAAVDKDTAAALILMTVSGSFLILFLAANNWGRDL